MEALAAFGLAASVLQVVDFGVRLVGNVGEIVDKGTTLSITDVDRAAVDLLRLQQNLTKSVGGVSDANPEDIVRHFQQSRYIMTANARFSICRPWLRKAKQLRTLSYNDCLS
jgi:hypothetical protein